jgi:hypothetical protein
MIAKAKIDNDTQQMRITRERTARLIDKQRCAFCIFAFWFALQNLVYFQSNRFSTNSLEIRGELVESPLPYGQVASVAILRISAILLDV